MEDQTLIEARRIIERNIEESAAYEPYSVALYDPATGKEWWEHLGSFTCFADVADSALEKEKEGFTIVAVTIEGATL